MTNKFNHPPRGIDPDDECGRVAFDERGNAVWETGRGRRLEHPGLEIAEDGPFADPGMRLNRRGTCVGYNPYNSGMLVRKEAGQKKDLRALSQWIEQQKGRKRR